LEGRAENFRLIKPARDKKKISEVPFPKIPEVENGREERTPKISESSESSESPEIPESPEAFREFTDESLEEEEGFGSEGPEIPQVRDVYRSTNYSGGSGTVFTEVPEFTGCAEDRIRPSIPNTRQLFHVSDPVSRDAMGAVVEKEEDYEMVMIGTGVNRGLKRKKRKKPEKKIVKLTPKPSSDCSIHAKLHRALSSSSGTTPNGPEPHPTGRRTLVGVSNLSDYDTMEYPQDDAFSYLGRTEVPGGREEWSSSSGEDVEEVIHRISHGKGNVSALMADGSEPTGIFLSFSGEASGKGKEDLGKGKENLRKGKGKSKGSEPPRKGKRGRKSEGFDIRRVPFKRVALAEDLLEQIEDYKGMVGIESGNRQDPQNNLMIQSSPIQSEMMLTTNRDKVGDAGGKTVPSKEISKGIPVVSPLTRIKQMFIKASRIPEEAAVIARAKELDNIQASIRFGNLNESEVYVHSNIRDFVHSGSVEKRGREEEIPENLDNPEDSWEKYGPGEYEEDMYAEDSLYDRNREVSVEEHFQASQNEQPVSLIHFGDPERSIEVKEMSGSFRKEKDPGVSGKEYSVLSLDVDTSSSSSSSSSLPKSFPEASFREVTETSGTPLTALDLVQEDFGSFRKDLGKEIPEDLGKEIPEDLGKEEVSGGFREESSGKDREYILTEKMNNMTKKMVMHEKKVKKIVSDNTLVGLSSVMMKGTVLDVFMFDMLECVRRRPSESVILSNGMILQGGAESDKFADASNLRMAPAKVVVWKEKDIFSLCSQLVDLQRERTLYRQKVMGVSGLWDDLTQTDKRAVLGDPCDVSFCGRYFRPPVGFERPCMWETECACYLIGQSNIFPDTLDRVASDTSFIGREFYTPDEEVKLKNRSWPKKRRACLLCYDMASLYAYYYYKRNDQPAPFLLQNHWNKTEGENAYSPALCFPLVDNDNRWTGFIAPKVMRIMTSLRPYETNVHVNGTMKTVPCFVEACQDFWLASTALAGSTRSEFADMEAQAEV